MSAKPAAVSGPGVHVSRRAVALGLGAGLATVGGGSGPAGAQASTPPALIQSMLGEGQRFGPGALADLARALSKRAFVAPPTDVPDPFANLPYERYVGVRALPASRVWAGENRGFLVEPLPRGFVFTTAVQLFTVEDGDVRRIAYDRSRFEFGGLNVPPNAPDPGFSGMRLYAGPDGAPLEFALVQGATFFRAVARGQAFGTVARALALKSGDPRGEEFPLFRAFWVERPLPGMNALVVHGLVDSESAAGTVRLTFRPGETTIVDVETTLFPRVAVENVGLGAMGASFLFGPNVRRTMDDVRPAAYEAAGLSMLNGAGEWIWRPLNNPDTLQISAFVDDNPKGFGLMQRPRDFAAFADDAQRYELRPSLWIEPIGDWSQGTINLIEIPSEAEINKNILAYWRPKAPMPAGSETTLAYRQFWAWDSPERSSLALVASTRSGKGGGGRRRRFQVEFRGDALQAAAELKPLVTAAPGAIQNARVVADPARRSVRVQFELDPGNETACELRLVLMAGQTPMSETWLYRWTP